MIKEDIDMERSPQSPSGKTSLDGKSILLSSISENFLQNSTGKGGAGVVWKNRAEARNQLRSNELLGSARKKNWSGRARQTHVEYMEIYLINSN